MDSPTIVLDRVGGVYLVPFDVSKFRTHHFEGPQ